MAWSIDIDLDLALDSITGWIGDPDIRTEMGVSVGMVWPSATPFTTNLGLGGILGPIFGPGEWGWETLPIEVRTLPEFMGPPPNFTVPEGTQTFVDFFLAALRVLAGLTKPGTFMPPESARQRIATTTLSPEVQALAREQVASEQLAAQSRVGARELLEEEAATGAGGVMERLPGQQQPGYNPNDPYLPGSGSDPAGPVDPRRVFPTASRIREILEALGIDVPDPRNPAVVKQVVLFWIGRALEAFQRRRLAQMMDEMEKQRSIAAQLELQRLLFYFRSLPATSQHFNARTLERVAELGLPTELPEISVEKRVKPLPVIVCGFEPCDEEENLCLGDSH